MCGIAGIVGDPSESSRARAVQRMSTALARRGPDDSGMEHWNTATLAHRRLAVYDTSSAGHQPMMNPDRSVAVSFNGSIYNFRELRKDLESEGYRFRSRADTEVLLNGYLAWGLDRLIDKIHGMFAFAIWDDRLGKLYLVRDRLGVKPLLYSEYGGRLAFASNTQAFEHAGLTGDCDAEAISQFLQLGVVGDDRSIYKNLAKLPAGCVLEWCGGSLSLRRYWSPPEVAEESNITFDEAVEETERLFIGAVRKRLYADVPVAALLSGGIDSSLVCWALSQMGAAPVAYTVATPGEQTDEGGQAKQTADQLGIRSEVLKASADSGAFMDALIDAYGEPFACESALGMLQLASLVQETATVLLTGDGGDDVFLGYPRHLHLWRAQQLASNLPQIATPIWKMSRALVPPQRILQRAVHFMDYSTGGLPAFLDQYAGLDVYRRAGLLGKQLRGLSSLGTRDRWSVTSARRVLGDYIAYQQNPRFVGEYLAKVDGATMYYGLEARSPFLDTDLWEFAARLPYHIRLRRGRLKAILRALARKKLGFSLSRRPKQGFSIPVQRWLTSEWLPRVQEAFRDPLIDRIGWINAKPLRQMLQTAVATGRAPEQLWYLFVLESWMRCRRNRCVSVH